MQAAIRRVLTDPAAFSRFVIERRPLRPYQLQVQRAVLASIYGRMGHTISMEMARQMGKNETVAQLECYLLNLFQRVGGSIVHAAPTFTPQAAMAKARLEDCLHNSWNENAWRGEWGRSTALGRARCHFISADPDASRVGLTASILLAADEFQDWDPGVWDKEFRPMASTTNATSIAWGVPWTGEDELARAKDANLDLQKRDRLQRHFEFDWQVLAATSSPYRQFVEAEAARLGWEHPVMRTQYRLLPLAGLGRLLSEGQRGQIQGDHPGLARRESQRALYVAGLDLAGEEEESEAIGESAQKRDAAALTIARVTARKLAEGIEEPLCEIVARYAWVGQKHPALYGTLLDLLKRVWRVRLLCVDATGVGAGIAAFLAKALGSDHVEACTFDSAWSLQTELAFNFLAMVNSGRFREHARAIAPEDLDRQAWFQYEHARARARPGQRMMVHVPDKEGHDDLLISALLCARAAATVPLGEAAAPAGVIIQPKSSHADDESKF